MVNTSCAVFRCGSTSHRHKGVKFHQFPKDERAQLWIKACKRPDLLGKDPEQLKHMHVCSLHFEQRMYGKHLLKKSATPTLYLPDTATNTMYTQTDNLVPILQILTSQGVQTDETPKIVKAEQQGDMEQSYHQEKNRMREQIVSKYDPANDYNNQITLEQFLTGCDTFLPVSISNFVKAHILVQDNV